VGSELAERILAGGPSLSDLEAAEARYPPLADAKAGVAATKAAGAAMAAAAAAALPPVAV
jgi:hypothetical protein